MLHTCGPDLIFSALLHSVNMLITLNDHPSPFCAAVKYKGVPCPVGKHGIELQFLDYSKPIPASSEICNNQFGVPCGGSVIKSPVRATLSPHGEQRHVCRAAYVLCLMWCTHGLTPETPFRRKPFFCFSLQGNPLSYMKLMVTSQRIPVSLVEVFLSNRWVPFKRSGDGYWQPGGTGFAYSAPVSVAFRPFRAIMQCAFSHDSVVELYACCRWLVQQHGSRQRSRVSRSIFLG